MKQFSKDLGNVSLAPKGRWSKEQEYERLNLVYNACDNLSYVAKIDVPIGVKIDNREYWQPMNATGYADNNFINLTTESETGTVTAYESLEEAVATILPINRRAGATLSFYNLNADRLDRQAEFELWQFNSTDLANWENRDYWNNIYYNWNVFAGWYVGADGLKNHVKIPNVGQYAYVGTNLNDALLYQCRTNGTWTNTGIKVRNYVSVVVSGNITIGENGNWFSDGEDTGIPATPSVDEQLDNIIMQLQQHTTEINNLKKSDANLQDQITSNDSDITNLTAKHESLSRTVQGIAATGGASTANNVTYNNDSSGLNAENAQDAIDELQSSKIDKTSILQESGEAEDKIMSQKAVSDKLSDLSISIGNDIHRIDTFRISSNGTWEKNANASSIIIPINGNDIVELSVNTTVFYSFFTDLKEPVINESPLYANGYNGRVVVADTKKIVSPDDAKYLYLSSNVQNSLIEYDYIKINGINKKKNIYEALVEFSKKNQETILAINTTLSNQASSINNIEKSISNNIQLIDKFRISTNGTWENNANSLCYIIPINGGDLIEVGNNIDDALFYTFLSDFSSPVNGQTPNYADGFTNRIPFFKDRDVMEHSPINAKYLYLSSTKDNGLKAYKKIKVNWIEYLDTIYNSLSGLAYNVKGNIESIKNKSLEHSNKLDDLSKSIGNNIQYYDTFRISASGTWEKNANALTAIIPINGGDVVKLESKNTAFYTFLSDFQTPNVGDTPLFADGYVGRVVIKNGLSIVCPNNTKYLYLSLTKDTILDNYNAIKINGIDKKYSLYESLSMLAKDLFTQIDSTKAYASKFSKELLASYEIDNARVISDSDDLMVHASSIVVSEKYGAFIAYYADKTNPVEAQNVTTDLVVKQVSLQHPSELNEIGRFKTNSNVLGFNVADKPLYDPVLRMDETYIYVYTQGWDGTKWNTIILKYNFKTKQWNERYIQCNLSFDDNTYLWSSDTLKDIYLNKFNLEVDVDISAFGKIVEKDGTLYTTAALCGIKNTNCAGMLLSSIDGINWKILDFIPLDAAHTDCYEASLDIDGNNIYIIVRQNGINKEDSNSSMMYYTKYNISTKIWDKLYSLTPLNGDPSKGWVQNYKGEIYLLYQTSEDRNRGKLAIVKLNKGTMLIDKEIVTFKAKSSVQYPSIYELSGVSRNKTISYLYMTYTSSRITLRDIRLIEISKFIESDS